MRMPGFWKAGESGILTLLLRPFGWIYGMATLLRLRRTGWQAPVPVISVGNFTAGGAGKTPAVIALVHALQARGEKPFVITRGYGGRARGPLIVDLLQHDATSVGDEPRLLAAHAPTIVSRNRVAGARMAARAGASVILLDDALQNPALLKDFSLAVVDGGFGFGNGEVVPAGPLRAPLAPMLGHAHAVLMVGADETGAAHALDKLPVFFGALAVDAGVSARISGKRIIAYCGIGRPKKFHDSLRASGAIIIRTHDFGDHHFFSADEASKLLAEARSEGAQLMTTEKDMARMHGDEALAQASIALPVALDMDPALLEMIYLALVSARKRISTASGPA